jgi:hypothetical protein
MAGTPSGGKWKPNVDRQGNFHGFYQAYKHHLFYSKEEQEIDRKTEDDSNDTSPTTSRTYVVSNRNVRNKPSLGLVDRGANGIVAGEDCVWMGSPVVERKVNISGIDNHQMNNIRIGTVGARMMTNRGPVIAVFNEAAYTGKNQTILSSIQLEHYKNKVDDRSVLAGGGQQITTADGYTIPLSIVSGLPYLQLRPYTRTEYRELPHVIMTSPEEWNPRIFDNDVDPDSSNFKQANPVNSHLLPHDDYDVRGEYIGAHNVALSEEYEEDDKNDTDVPFWLEEEQYCHNETVARCVSNARQIDEPTASIHLEAHPTDVTANRLPRTHNPTEQDYASMQPYFAWIQPKLIKHTFKNSTQYGYMPASPDGNLFKRWNSPNPAMNVFRIQDDLLTDKI